MAFYLTKIPFLLRWIYPDLVWKKEAGKKILYLTFDDGPVPEATATVLQILSERKIKATFFCVGDNVRKHPELFKRLVEDGHTIGNHTYNHLNGWKTERMSYVDNVIRCNEEFKKNGVECSLFRPPYGRIKRTQIDELQQSFTIVMWDVLSGDFDRKLAPRKCLERTIKATRDGSVITFHDSMKAIDKLEEVLPPYIDHFLAKGYKFLPL